MTMPLRLTASPKRLQQVLLRQPLMLYRIISIVSVLLLGITLQ